MDSNRKRNKIIWSFTETGPIQMENPPTETEKNEFISKSQDDLRIRTNRSSKINISKCNLPTIYNTDSFAFRMWNWCNCTCCVALVLYSFLYASSCCSFVYRLLSSHLIYFDPLHLVAFDLRRKKNRQECNCVGGWWMFNMPQYAFWSVRAKGQRNKKIFSHKNIRFCVFFFF